MFSAWEHLCKLSEPFFRNVTPEQFAQLHYEMWVTRDVDSFQQYLVEMSRRVFTERPETLRSSDTVKIREVLECVDMDDFIKRVADRKVNSLAYEGLGGMITYLTGTLGLPFDTGGKSYRLASDFIELRNIITHNGCRVSATYLRRTQRKDVQEGQRIELNQASVLEGAQALGALAKELDKAFVNHFRLPFCATSPGASPLHEQPGR